MRGTLHFVAAGDVRWMLQLLAPRAIAGSALRARQLELDDRTFVRSRKLFARALHGGRQLTRGAMYARLEAAHIPAAAGRGLHILWRLAHEGFLCFGAREGRQPTFVLLDEWVPAAGTMARDEALAELARRYFTSHGPATVRDFVWWSGLRTADAAAALDMARSHLVQEVMDGDAFWGPSKERAAPGRAPAASMLPPFDEYIVAYKNRTAVLDPLHSKAAQPGNGVFSPTIVLNGKVVGTWTRTRSNAGVVIAPSFFVSSGEPERRAIVAAAKRYGRFLGLPVRMDA